MRKLIVPTEYPTIQKAVDAACPGDTIKILNGIYTESVYIDKCNIKIESTIDALLDGTNIVGNGITIDADNVDISGLRIKGFATGIIAQGNCNSFFDLDVVFNELFGIKFSGDENRVTNCSLGGNGVVGLTMSGSKNCITHNTIDQNSIAGINVFGDGGCENEFIHNNISATRVGLTILDKFSKNNKIKENVIRFVEFGIAVFKTGNIIERNFITEATNAGILVNGSENTVVFNNIEKSKDGIVVIAGKSLISNNALTSSENSGIIVMGYENCVYSNILNSNDIGITLLNPENKLRENVFNNNKTDILKS